MNISEIQINPKFIPELDTTFKPPALINKAFLEMVVNSARAVPLAIAIERADGQISTFKTQIFHESHELSGLNIEYAERLIKTLLWVKGGFRIIVGGPRYIGEYIKKIYTYGGLREFDVKFMERVYEKNFSVDITDFENVPPSNEKSKPVGRNLDGCRIGFDAGGSDRKVSAVIDGKPVYSEEVIWHPKTNPDPDYHFSEILAAIRSAASHMPRVDAIGVSSAGVYINNRAMVASLFLKVPEELYHQKVKNIYLNIQKELNGIPLEVANDGDVTALAGAMDLKDTNILGIAMGTSEAAGYVDGKGYITGWINELAFVPADLFPGSAVDEWSGDYGCGVKYFSQDAVIKLAPAAGITLDSSMTPAQKLEVVQDLMKTGDERAKKIFRSIGCYLGYTLANYSEYYDIKHALILGRVTSGEGGTIILDMARKVLTEEFPYLESKIALHLPDESNRRVGQSIAAASLPKIG